MWPWIVLTLSLLAQPPRPETVMITLRVRGGAEQRLADTLARHYAVARRLHMILDAAPHLTLRSIDEHGRAYFVEILTWRSAATPDNAPAAVQAIWRDMNALVEPRDSHPGLEIAPMTEVTTAR